MRVWLYCFIVYIKILSYSRQSLLTKQQIRLEVSIISQQVYLISLWSVTMTPMSCHGLLLENNEFYLVNQNLFIFYCLSSCKR